jgi:D-beta-D-heptose 7-phosphate kinase/D-beta-D-heptose 1-phosphate adenosyltransferase
VLHAGHVEYLLAASFKAHEKGMPLLVAVNSDLSVTRLKGVGRPINTLGDRAKVLGALRCVDAVTWFNDNTPYELIKKVQPTLLIKAEDYANKTIVGADLVKGAGGEVWLAPYRHGLSTSEIVRKGGA